MKMVQNMTTKAIESAEEIKFKISSLNDSGYSAERNSLLAQLQQLYRNILLADLDIALDKKIEQDLWNFGFKNKIEILQARAKDKKNPRRSESQTLLSSTLQSATGFFVCLLHQICNSFQIDLPFRFKLPNSATNNVEKFDGRFPQPSSCCYICQYCLVHLGDLARYNRQSQYADSFYRQALGVSHRNGQPYNQLGLLRAARGDKLGAAYFHVRSLAVGGPFPPAANNLSRTLASGSLIYGSFKKEIKSKVGNEEKTTTTQLNPQTYINNYIAVHYELQKMSNLEDLKENIIELNSNLIALIATDKFDNETLIEMCCLDLFAIFSITEDHKLNESQLSKSEKKVFSLAMELVAGTLAALLLPAHTRDPVEILSYPALPAIKILLEYIKLHPTILQHFAFTSRPQIWPGMCTILNNLQDCTKDFSGEQYSIVPLPEDVELQGFLPVDCAFALLQFDGPIYRKKQNQNPPLSTKANEIDQEIGTILREQFLLKKKSQNLIENIDKLKKSTSFLNSLRAFRFIQLGEWLADYHKNSGNDYFHVVQGDNMNIFKSFQNTFELNPDVLKTIQEISILREKHLTETSNISSKIELNTLNDLSDTEKEDINLKLTNDLLIQEELSSVPSVVISEADFKAKVKEKRAGILKPQGSLEKARVEKALSRSSNILSSPELLKTSHDDIIDSIDLQDTGSSSSTVSQDGTICTDISSLLESSTLENVKKETKKVRTNIAMQAIMKKQEECSKQVKFVSPTTTPDPILENFESFPNENITLGEKRIIIQPKVLKTNADRKTGGILSLKDKSGGYPHLVKIDIPKTESSVMENISKTKYAGSTTLENPTKNYESPPQNPSTNYYTPWSDGKNSYAHSDKFHHPPHNVLNYGNQMRKFDMQNPQSNQCNSQPYSYFSQNSENTNICFPVVNPKEINVRSMTMQRQKNNAINPNNFHNANRYKDSNPWENFDYTNRWHNFASPANQLFQNPNQVIHPRFTNPSEYDYKKMEMANLNPNFQINIRPSEPNSFNQSINPESLWWNPPVFNENEKAPLNSHNFHQPPPFNTHIDMGLNSDTSRINYSKPIFNPLQSSFEKPISFLPYKSQVSAQHNEVKLGANMSPIDAFNSDYGNASGSGLKYDANIPEFIPNELPIGSGSRRNLDTSSNDLDSNVNTYTLFSPSNYLWEDKNASRESNPPQATWTGIKPSPLEKLIEQQKQSKHTPNDKN